MKPPDEAWVRHMAELEDGLPVSAGGRPFRQVEPPSTVEPEVQWLQAMAELEDGLPVSAGGWPFRILGPATRPADADTETRATEDRSSGSA